ncbi:MAG: acyltransferase [Lachnospiraceae bacterium]|nr:acyltransferase [Lachnospiraceae bacterium]
MNTKERILWIDVCKFFGIFAIYLGHYGAVAGKLYSFVFVYHVPLFFFLSGCLEKKKNENFKAFFLNKTEKILIPWLIFCTLCLFLCEMNAELTLTNLHDIGIGILKGCVRNNFFAGSLWFLTALFIMQNICYFIRKIPYTWVIIAIALVFSFAGNIVLPYAGITYPSLWWNVDSVMRYLIFYVIGYISFPHLNKLLATKEKKYIIFKNGLFLISICYAGCLYMGKDIFSPLFKIPIISLIISIVKILIIIYCNIILAYFFSNVGLFQYIGQNTLWLCGAEYGIKLITPQLLAIVGLGFSIVSPLGALLITFIMLLAAMKTLVPIEKGIYDRLMDGIELCVQKNKAS